MLRTLKFIYWDLKDKYGRLEYYNVVLALLPGNMGMHLRQKVLPRYFKSCGRPVYIHERFRFRSIHNLTLGNRVRIGVDNFIQAAGGVTLEDDVMLGPGVKIWSLTHVYEDVSKPIIDQGYECDPVIIGRGSWLGASVFVLPGVKLPEGCIVSAGTVVNKKQYPAFCLIAGNPCRVVGIRNAPEGKSL